jgi:lipid A 3-O-deacylase
MPIEVGVMVGERFTVSAYFEHISNGGLGTHINEGLDNLGGRIGYTF